MFDWSDGEYELTARALAPASERVVDAAELSPGLLALDLGCGTGNGALALARRGAEVTALDPAPRLLDVARTRLADEGLHADCVPGDATTLPFENASFDRVVSIFAVIFAPDPAKAASEIVRVLRRGGLAVLTSWIDDGPIAAAGNLLVEALTGQPSSRRPGPKWGVVEDVHALFSPRDVELEVDEERLVFEASSATAWMDEQEHHHPAWRQARAQLGARWAEVRRGSIEALEAGNEASSGFRTTSRYLVIRVRKRISPTH